jgi:hypothetical protein
MVSDSDEWRPGSFTKNFSWGSESGLGQLYDCIRVGFDNNLKNVLRETFRRRVQGRYSFYIPANFFLFNRQIGGKDYLIVDELVFQALTAKHTQRFDKLALFAFNFSYAGHFKGAAVGQRRPALWAHWYVRERLAKEFGWNTRKVNADDIERYIRSDPRYRAQGARKVATNLNHLYKIGRLRDVGTDKVERWWVDAIFLAMDRLIEDRLIGHASTRESGYASLLDASGFMEITGRPSLEKNLAVKHVLRLYVACGSRERFSEEAVKQRTELKLSDIERWISPNDTDPLGAVHPTNPTILKSIPAACAMLAHYDAGFEIISSMEMDDFDPVAFVRKRTRTALDRLKAEGIEPTMSAEEVLRMTRGR